jgi:prepilin-type processing-associated H-X9-DG protein
MSQYDAPDSGYGGSIGSLAPLPEYFAEPGNTLWFMDSASGYAGNYVEPPMWAEVYNTWPDTRSPHWWQTYHPSRRHMGNFNGAFLDGHAINCKFETYYDVGPFSSSARYWGSWEN